MNTELLSEFFVAARNGMASQARTLTRELKARHGSEVIDVVVTFN